MKKWMYTGLAAAVSLCALSAFSACGGSAEVTFSLNEDETSYSVSGVSGTKSALASFDVPSEYDGLPVTRIEDEAFWRCTALRKVTLPEGIEYIGDRAFAQCPIDEITIPSTVTEIGYAAFGMCDSLKEVTVPESVTVLEARAFYACTALERVYFRASVTDIGIGVFENTVQSNGTQYYYNTSLTEVYLSASVEKMHKTALYGNYVTDIYFAGTQEQWDALYFYEYEEEDGETVESVVDKEDVLPTGLTVHCNVAF